jgi:hypothetical protein
MSTCIVEAELLEQKAVRPPIVTAQPLLDPPDMEEGDRLAVARGVVTGVIISAPFWILAGFTVYMLL